MSAKEKDSEPSQEELKDEHCTKTSEVHELVWQLNEPIDVDAYEPTVKDETLPVITKVESISDTLIKEVVAKSTKSSAMARVCNSLQLNIKWPVAKKRQVLKKKISKVKVNPLKHDINKMKKCKSIFISQMPAWFDHPHVESLIQLLSDIEDDMYYVDIFKNIKNESTGKCLIRFIDNKDCLQLFKEMQGVQFKGVLLVVELDFDNNIAARKDRDSQNLDERFLKFMKRCEQHNKNDGDNMQETHLAAGSTIIIKTEPGITDCEPNIKSEVLENSADFEIYNKDLVVKQEAITETENVGETENNQADAADKSEPLQKSNQSEKQNVECQVVNKPEQSNYFYDCKIVHIKNLLEVCAADSCYDLIKSWLKNDIGFNEPFTFRRVRLNNTDHALSGDIILGFPRHRVAKKFCKKFDGFSYKGKTLEAKMGIGYEILPQIFVSDLKRFALKRKLKRNEREETSLNENNEGNGQPAKKAKTDTSSATDPGEGYTTGFMHPEERCFEAHGLAAQFMKKMNLKIPLSRTVLVFWLHLDVNEEKLHEIFSLAGEVKKVTVTIDPACSLWKKARIEFDHALEAVQAISMFHKQKLYNKEMHVEMEPLARQVRTLPKGLSAVGPGLANNGLPLRGLRTYAELRLIHEMFVDLGCMERTSNFDKPMRFTYKKCKPKDRPRDSSSTNSSSNKDVYSNTSRSTRSSSDNSASKFSSNAHSSSSPSKSSNVATSKGTQRNEQSKSSNATDKDTTTKEQDSETSKSTSLAIQALGTVLVTQGLIPSTTNCNNLLSILAALQKNAIVSRRADEQSSKPNANVEAPETNQGMPIPKLIPKNANVPLNKPETLNQAINRLMQSMPGNTAINVQNNLPQSYQNMNPIQPSIPLQNMAPGMPQPAYGNPPSRFDIGPNVNCSPMLPAPIRNPIPQHMLNPPGTVPLMPLRPVVPVTRIPFNQTMPQNFPMNRPMPPALPYDQMQKVARNNLIEVQPTTSPISTTSRDKNPTKNSSEGDSNQIFNQSGLLVFKNLPESVSTEALAVKMKEIGEVKFCEMTGKGSAFVRFYKQPDAERCIRLFHRSKVDGQIITVGFL